LQSPDKNVTVNQSVNDQYDGEKYNKCACFQCFLSFFEFMAAKLPFIEIYL
jgi:hypothetical protein